MHDDTFDDYPIPAPPQSDADDNVLHTGPWWDWYKGYLKSPQWEARRKALLEQAQGCEACDTGPAKEAHHKTYRNAGREPLSDLEALCPGCHDDRHGIFSTEIGALAAEALVLLSQNDDDGPVKRLFS
jgi:5-methylcytosine-specific restriction endonuclease McrA